MPRLPGRPERKLRDLDADLKAGLLFDGFLVFWPGNHKFRCVYCDRLFDSIGESLGDPPRTYYGAWLAMGRHAENRIGTACPECVLLIDKWHEKDRAGG